MDKHLGRFQYLVDVGNAAAYILDQADHEVDNDGHEVLAN